MKIIITFFFLIFNVTISFSQKKVIVIDSLQQKAIAYVNVSMGNNNGTYTNDNGVFEVDKNSNDTLRLSHISYNEYVIKISDVKDTIILSPNAVLLKEISISNKQKISKYIDFPRKKNNFSSWPVSPQSEIISLVIPSSENVNSTIENLTFNFVKKKEKNSNIANQTAIRINIYNADKKQKLKKQIYSSNTILINPNRKDKVELNIENEHIELIKNGIFIGLEVIGDIDNSGNIIKENSYIHVTLTDNTIEDYKSKSYIKYIFDRTLNLMPINDILKKTSGKDVNRSMSFGMTIIK